MGNNKKNELGLGNTNFASYPKHSVPIRIQALDRYDIKKVVAGDFSTALTYDNDILIWGTGEFGSISSP